MLLVKQKTNESIESLIRRFGKEVSKAGTMQELRQRRWYVPKSEVRRIEKKKAERRARRRQSAMRSYGG